MKQFISSRLELSRVYFYIIALIAVATLGAAVTSFNEIPFMDMWDGYINFYLRLSEKSGLNYWWAQHNEHRIILSRLLFYLDFYFFRGGVWFLIIVNYLLVLLSAILFAKIILENLKLTSKSLQVRFVLFLFAWLFCWAQKENLIWGFQSQFFLAYLLPLASFYFFSKSLSLNRHPFDFPLSVILGFLAIGSMANGVITLPIIFLAAFFLRCKWQKLLTLALFSIIGITLYFANYRPVAGHGSLKNELLNNFMGLLQYVALYLGNPFYHLLGKSSVSLVIAYAMGFFFVVTSVYYAYTFLWIRRKKAATTLTALILFFVYVGATSFATAGGRLMFGVDQALSSRYVTPSLMAWAGMFILLFVSFEDKVLRLSMKKVHLTLIVAALILLVQVASAFHPKYTDRKFDQTLAVLSIAMGVKDNAKQKLLYPSAERVFTLGNQALKADLKPFINRPFLAARTSIGSQLDLGAREQCTLDSIKVEVIDTDHQWKKITGVIENLENHNYDYDSNLALSILDQKGIVIGSALVKEASQLSRDRLINFLRKSPDHRVQFEGYVKGEAVSMVTPDESKRGCIAFFPDKSASAGL